jgi:methionyl-tRNA formyltransferase
MNTPPPHPCQELRIAVAGAVGSTERLLAALIRHRAGLVGVLGLDARAAGRTSGYRRLEYMAREAGIPYVDFQQINAPDTIAAIRRWQVDLLFVVGLSQLVGPVLLGLPRRGCVGFHPTRLPEGRGRAPLAWLALEGRPGAATFFLMNEEADAGPILVQEPFAVTSQDDAQTIYAAMEAAIDRALDRWLPQLLAGAWHPMPQDESLATFYGRRAPADGLIDWEQPSHRILRLVRAVSRPYPGAFSYFRHQTIVIWRAELAGSPRWTGVPGRLLLRDRSHGWLVATGDGALWLEELEVLGGEPENPDDLLHVGARLGYVPQEEIFRLRRQVAELAAHVAALEQRQRDAS